MYIFFINYLIFLEHLSVFFTVKIFHLNVYGFCNILTFGGYICLKYIELESVPFVSFVYFSPCLIQCSELVLNKNKVLFEAECKDSAWKYFFLSRLPFCSSGISINQGINLVTCTAGRFFALSHQGSLFSFNNECLFNIY